MSNKMMIDFAKVKAEPTEKQVEILIDIMLRLGITVDVNEKTDLGILKGYLKAFQKQEVKSGDKIIYSKDGKENREAILIGVTEDKKMIIQDVETKEAIVIPMEVNKENGL